MNYKKNITLLALAGLAERLGNNFEKSRTLGARQRQRRK